MPRLSEYGRKIWNGEIESAKQRVEAGKANPSIDDRDYNITINPEDFLDLISGKWDEPQA